MKKIKIFLLSVASSLGALAADIDVTPGQLESILNDAAKDQTELKLKGSIDARDFAALENLSSDIKTLDMSGVSIQSLTMPSRKYFGRTLFGEGEIPAYAFFKTGVTSLILPDRLSVIGEGAFANADITEITVPEGVTAIGDYAFYGCPNLKSVTLPSSLKTIGKGAFGNCVALESLDLSKTTGLTEIPERAFAGSVKLGSISLPASVEKIGREAFSHTRITTLDLNNVLEFDAYALSGMPFLNTLILNSGAEMTEGLLMDDISLESLSGVPEYLPDYFAANCGSLNTGIVELSKGLGSYSLANTHSPDVLILSEGFSTINRGALSGLDSLKQINVSPLGGDIPEVEEDAFEGLNPADIVLWVHDTYYDDWKNAPVWNQFKVTAESMTDVTNIPVGTISLLDISCTGNHITVKSSVAVDDVRIYTADGRLAYVASPGEESVEIETASLPSGVVVVTASDRDGNSSTVSILLK